MDFKRHCVCVLGCAALLAGCAFSPTLPVGMLKVDYSQTYIDGSRLEETPTEVRIVQRETTGRNVAAQVGLNVLMLALGGGVVMNTFGKDDLTGDEITDVTNRVHLINPVPTAFVKSLQDAVDARMAQEGIWKDRDFRNPLIVGGGRAALVYDTLTGSGDPLYQFVLQLDVYKRGEGSWVMPPRLVQCSGRSEPPQPLAQWAESSYAGVKQELNRMLDACQQKVLAQLPDLLDK